MHQFEQLSSRNFYSAVTNCGLFSGKMTSVATSSICTGSPEICCLQRRSGLLVNCVLMYLLFISCFYPSGSSLPKALIFFKVYCPKCLSLRNLSYAERLTKLDRPSLELRRLQLDLIYCYKIVFGLVKLNYADFFRVFYCVKYERTCI